MLMTDIIEKKRDGFSLSKEEIEFFIMGYTKGEIPDYQVSSLLMAIYFQGMTDSESTDLAYAMLKSGDEIDLSSIEGIKVDKHSTGGVGDKTTLVLAPLVASFGVKFAKMSGRGLGHTGGTLDKLESIKGFNVLLDNEAFVKQVNDINLCVIGQTKSLAPADKLLYALRDVTGTVPSIPLIASSIMSKKLASGANAICLDVKVGKGAFMKNVEDATKLARLMVNIGNNMGRKMVAVLTNMEEPLGCAVGNSLEVIEAINTLNGHGPKDLEELCITIATELLLAAGRFTNAIDARKALNENLHNGKALEKLIEMVSQQGGDTGYVKNTDLFEKSKKVIAVTSDKTGYVKGIDALKIGIGAMHLGAGRATKDDKIDFAVGIVLNKKVNDSISVGEDLAYVHTNGLNTEMVIKMIKDAFTISNESGENKLILGVVK